jgi:hypothetical protein
MEIVKQTEFARRCGVQVETINRAMKAGKVNCDGKRVIADGELSEKFLAACRKKGKVPYLKRESSTRRPVLGPPKKPKVVEENKPWIDMGEGVGDFQEYTLKEICKRFGSHLQFIDVLNSVKKIVEIEERQIKNSVSKGELVSRELVNQQVLGPMKTTIPQILSDGSKQIARKVSVMKDSGASLNDMEREVSAILLSFLGPMRDRMIRGNG